MDNIVGMTLYLRADVTLANEKKELHLLKVEVNDLDSLEGDKVDELLKPIKAECIKKSKGVSCKIMIISREQFNCPWLIEI